MVSPNPLAVDIETVGVGWDTLDEDIQEYLLGRASDEEEREAVPNQLGLNPATGRVIAIGMWRPEENRGGVLVESAGEGDPAWEKIDGRTSLYEASEEEILREFWDYALRNAGQIITYNGRRFDGPFLMLRSAILDIEPTRNLLPYRYSFKEHCDLAEVVSFRGARQMETLDFWCRQMGLPSPKVSLEGSQIGEYYKQGRTDEIVSYCLEDVKATAQLYQKLKPVIEVMESG